jgi:thiol:disulfide interchange protein
MNERMDKNEILKVAKKEKSKGKEFENRVGIKSNLVGLLAALIVGIILFLVEYFVKKTWNIALVAVFMTAAGVQMLYEGIRIKSIWRIIVGVIQILIALFFSLGFIGQVIS